MNKLQQGILLAAQLAAGTFGNASTGNSRHRVARVHKFNSAQVTKNKKAAKRRKKHSIQG
jgi:hypothetical protein